MGLPDSLGFVKINSGDFGNPENFSSNLGNHILLRGARWIQYF